MKRDEPFQHPRFPIYLVTRLAGYDVTDVKAMIDRALAARNRGKFVLDLQSADDDEGNNWLRTAAILLPADRAFMDETTKVVTLQKDVIGYASWGSNDSQPQDPRHRVSVAAGRDRRGVRFHQRAHLQTSARQLDVHDLAGPSALLRRLAAGSDRRPDPPGRHRRLGQYLRAVPRRGCVRPDYLFPGVLPGPQSRRELLHRDAGAELAGGRGRRSAVSARQAVRPASR